MLRHGESGTSALIGQTKPDLVNFFVLVPSFVFTWHKEKARTGASTREGKQFDPWACACAC